MSPENYAKMQELIKIAMPIRPKTPTVDSCSVEAMAKEVVLRQDCRRNAGCVLCKFSGLECEQIVAISK